MAKQHWIEGIGALILLYTAYSTRSAFGTMDYFMQLFFVLGFFFIILLIMYLTS